MIEAENETLLPVAASRVWHTLLAFDRYPRWNPAVRLRGEAALGATIEWTFALTTLSKRSWTTHATIVELEPMHTLAFQIRVLGPLRTTERFILDECAGGTRLRHSLEYHGLSARLFRGMGKRAQSLVARIDTALLAHLLEERRTILTGAIKRPKKNPSRRR